MRITFFLSLFLLLGLAACSAGSDEPTPAALTPPTPAEALLAEDLATPTRLPLPSPTPTSTPWPSPSAVSVALTGTATPAPDEAAEPQAEVLAAALNVRTGPGRVYPVIDTARAGDRFEVIGASPGRDWLQVRLDDETPGWISGQPQYVRLIAGRAAELPLIDVAAPPVSVTTPPDSSPIDGKELSGRLVFMTGSGGNLFVIAVDGTGLRRLAGGVIDPVVSPDGTQVAFTRWDGAEFGAVFIVNMADGQERVVLSDIRQPKSPTWSPDGEALLISFQHGGLRDPQEECREFDFDDGIRLPEEIAEITSFKTTRDGISICFIRKEDLQWILRRIDVGTGAFEDLPSDTYAYNPAWSPVEPWRVIYDGSKGLMQFDLNRRQQTPLTTDLRDTGPVFSPDGRRLALTYKQHGHWEVYTLDLPTGQRRRLTKPPILADPQYNSAAPAWSPAGNHLAFVTDRTGQWEIWVMGADGSQQRPLFGPEIQAQLPLVYRGVNERMLNWLE